MTRRPLASYAARCAATIEGPRAKGTRAAVMYRRPCRAYPLRGFLHCEFHLTEDERERFTLERGRSPRHRP